jgi:acyl-coenzyme A synthetase/AMP-(fatty) acid ligase
MGAASGKGGAAAAAAAAGGAVWDVLGAEVTAQLLGHIVVDVPAAAAAGSGGAGVAGDSSRHGQKVLLVLVPEAQLSRVLGDDFSGSSSSSSSWRQDGEQQQQQLCALTGMTAVTCAFVLPTVRQYMCVGLSEAEWLRWAADGGQQQQAQALQQLLTAAV